MNRIKAASRNHLQVAHLNQLMCKKLKPETDQAINLDKVFNHWRSEKDRWGK